MGMLSTAAYILAMDTFGPITDNAGGIIEMSHQPEEIANRTDRLDSVAIPPRRLTKGYAIAARRWRHSCCSPLTSTKMKVAAQGERAVQRRHRPRAGVHGALLGAMLVFLFSSFAIKAVGARRRLGSDRRSAPPVQGQPGHHAGGRRIRITARASTSLPSRALKAMVVPGVLAVASPVAVGMVFRLFCRSERLRSGRDRGGGGFLMVGTITGILLATLMNNGGGAWYNAQEYIETGAYGGKGSDAHKASVVGDCMALVQAVQRDRASC